MTDVSHQTKNDDNWPIPEGLLYDRNNFWIRMENRIATVGLTAYGQWVIGDILYLDLVPAGSPLLKGERFGSVESGKWVGNLVAPVDGVVRAYNPAVTADPRLIQEDPYGRGWIMQVELSAAADGDAFMDRTAYAAYVQEQARDAA